ncbi:hypothetical protein [Aeromicrobium sp. PE09-221]|uniref:hypothetical protein n=1 Tax=Aeromicrobium sp. PE09-221 TaxID=1898043 RepID=UPI0011249DDF|nr:hypothetical protein [Aeromicrobium sp. PE09-221]
MPRGPLPAAIYWRRRLLFVTVLIAVTWVSIQVWNWSQERGDDSPAASPSPSATPTEADPSPEPEPEPEPTDLVPVSMQAPQDACTPENVRIVPSVADGQPGGADVEMKLLVSTVDGEGCVLNPTDAELLVIIAADGSPVFDSTVCREPLLSEPIAVPAGWAVQASMPWNGRNSGSACGDGEPPVGQGDYTVQIGTLGGEPGETSFRLAEPEPEPEPEPSEEAEEETPDDEDPPAEESPVEETPAEG